MDSLSTECLSGFIIRPAIFDDLPMLVDFQMAMAVETEGLQLDRQTLTAGISTVINGLVPGQYYVVVAETKLVAMTLITHEWSDWRNGVIWWMQSVYVLPTMRRGGIFRMLYHWICSQVRQTSGVRGLRLYVDRRNLAAQQTYTALGMNGDHYQVFEWMPDDPTGG